jgi:hypothetical protein
VTELSRSDKQMISELEEGRERLLSEPSLLLSNLRRKLESITPNVYVFDWIPEQGEDWYGILVDGTTVVHIEIPRDASGEVIFEKWSVRDYLNTRKKRLRGVYRRKFEIALRLAERRAGQATYPP